MRSAYDPHFVFSNGGNVIGIATGYDSCAEHEGGILPIMKHLCPSLITEQEEAEKLRSLYLTKYPDSGFDDLTDFNKVASGFMYGSFIESRKIKKGFDKLKMLEKDDEVMIVYNGEGIDFDHREIQYSFKQKDSNKLAAAWDSRSFAIRAGGKKYAKALKRFYQSMIDGNCAIGSKFFTRDKAYLSGIKIVDMRYLTANDHAAIKQCQKSRNSNVRLHAASQVEALRDRMTELSGDTMSPGYIWSVWGDKEQTGVKYAINPGYAVKADYFGPYTLKQLCDWAAEKYSYHLKPE